jgi:hypothetical protein
MSDGGCADDTGFEEDAGFEDDLAVLLRLARASHPEDPATRTVNGWRRASSTGSSDADLERCRHGFTAAQLCDACDREAS